MHQILNHPYFVKSRQLMVSTKNCKKQEAPLPSSSSVSSTIKTATTVSNTGNATELHPTCQQLQQQTQRQQWIKSTTPSTSKQKPFSLFSKIANTCSSNSELSSNKYKNQQYKISMHAVSPTQASFLL